MNQYHIHVRGLVQGVGFRPYVYRLATEMGLRGYVDNSNDGVFIVLQSTCIQKEKFLKALIKSAPEVASDRKSTRLNSSHKVQSRMPSSA